MFNFNMPTNGREAIVALKNQLLQGNNVAYW